MDDESIRLFLHGQLAVALPTLTLYYRPPGNLLLSRPCVIYEPRASEPTYSSNVTYIVGTRFQITILSDLPGYPNKRNMFDIPGVQVVDNNSYVREDIVHDVFTVLVNVIR